MRLNRGLVKNSLVVGMTKSSRRQDSFYWKTRQSTTPEAGAHCAKKRRTTEEAGQSAGQNKVDNFSPTTRGLST